MAENYFPPELRRQLRAQMAEIIPAEHVDEVVDLTIHAAESARTTVYSIAKSASDPVTAFAILAPAFSLVATMAADHVTQLRSFAGESGMTMHEKVVRL